MRIYPSQKKQFPMVQSCTRYICSLALNILIFVSAVTFECMDGFVPVLDMSMVCIYTYLSTHINHQNWPS